MFTQCYNGISNYAHELSEPSWKKHNDKLQQLCDKIKFWDGGSKTITDSGLKLENVHFVCSRNLKLNYNWDGNSNHAVDNEQWVQDVRTEVFSAT